MIRQDDSFRDKRTRRWATSLESKTRVQVEQESKWKPEKNFHSQYYGHIEQCPVLADLDLSWLKHLCSKTSWSVPPMKLPDCHVCDKVAPHCTSQCRTFILHSVSCTYDLWPPGRHPEETTVRHTYIQMWAALIGALGLSEEAKLAISVPSSSQRLLLKNTELIRSHAIVTRHLVP